MTLEKQISDLVAATQNVKPTPVIASKAIGLIDHTSLNGDETEASIEKLCREAASNPHTAAVCVYPQAVPVAAKFLHETNVRVATVTNFPHGTASAKDAFDETIAVIKAGANEIDTVIDYQLLLAGGHDNEVAEKLRAVKQACGDIPLKVILKTTAYKDDYATMSRAARIALEAGADFLKTSTGKLLADGSATDTATPESAAVLFTALRDYKELHPENTCGVKISGGVSTPQVASRFIEMWQVVADVARFPTADEFRFGASSKLRTNLLDYINTGAVAKTNPSPNAY